MRKFNFHGDREQLRKKALDENRSAEDLVKGLRGVKFDSLDDLNNIVTETITAGRYTITTIETRDLGFGRGLEMSFGVLSDGEMIGEAYLDISMEYRIKEADFVYLWGDDGIIPGTKEDPVLTPVYAIKNEDGYGVVHPFTGEINNTFDKPNMTVGYGNKFDGLESDGWEIFEVGKVVRQSVIEYNRVEGYGVLEGNTNYGDVLPFLIEGTNKATDTIENKDAFNMGYEAGVSDREMGLGMNRDKTPYIIIDRDQWVADVLETVEIDPTEENLHDFKEGYWTGFEMKEYQEETGEEAVREPHAEETEGDVKDTSNKAIDGWLINTREFIDGVNNSREDYYEKTIRFFGGGGVIITLTSLTKLYVTDIDTNETVLFTTLETSPADKYNWGWDLRDALLDLEIILGRSNWRKELKFKEGSTAITRQEVIKAVKAEGLTFTADALKDLDWNVIAYINEREISAKQWIEEIISGNTEDVSDLFEKTGNYRRYFTDADSVKEDDVKAEDKKSKARYNKVNDSEGLDDQFKEDAEAIIKELDQVVPIDSHRELDYYTLNIVFGTDSDESDDDAIDLMLYFDRYSYELSYRNDNRTNDIDVMRIEDVLERLGFEIH